MNRTTWAAALILAACAASAPVAGASDDAGTHLTKEKNRVVVTLDGKPFTDYYFGPTEDHPYVRPFMYPVLAADGVCVTSDQINVKGGDHPHHRSIYVAHGSVNGVDHWSLAKQLKGEKQPQQRHLRFEKLGGDSFVEDLDWEGEDDKPILHERRTVRFFQFNDADHDRGIDLTLEFTPAAGPVTFGDTKEAGLCAVRVAGAISKRATITESTGATATAVAPTGNAKADAKANDKIERAVWGKAADWCDESGKIDGKPYGVAIFDHPSNPRHPSTWHARLYGLITANIFGLHEFDKTLPPHAGDLTIEPGKSLTFRYEVVVHEGNAAAAKLDVKYKQYAGSAAK